VDRVLRIVPVPADRESDQVSSADDVALVAALRTRQPWAAPALVSRYGGHLRRVLIRVLGGSDSELADVLQDVIFQGWEGIEGLTDARALKSWLTQIAIFTARKAIRRRQRHRWLTFFENVPEPTVTSSVGGADLHEAANCVYRIFDRMPVDERIPFALRMLEGLDLEATAAACGMSVATVRRRLLKAERRFFKMARQFEALAPWIEDAS
jgi:RNA polymerase sigma-70 factor, ECF subfamily